MKNPVLIIDLDTKKVIGMAKNTSPTHGHALQSKSGRFAGRVGMIKHLLQALVLLTALSMVLFLMPLPVFATDPPDSAPTAEFWVYQNLLETGDRLMLIYQNIPYGTIPDDPIWQTYMWRMLDTDNTTELGTALSYAFNDSGYGYNLTSMYWDAANVTAAGMMWNTTYTVRLSQNPIMFTSPADYNFSLSAADYSVLTAEADVKAELAARILAIGAELDQRWALGATYSLLNETETGTVLSIYGEAFFRGAIYGLQGLCPQVFAYIISDLDLTARTWSTSYVTVLENQYAGTWVDTAKAAGATLFGTTYDLTALIVTLIVCGVLAALAIILSGDAWHGFADARTGLIIMTRLGFFNLGFLALLGALAVIYGASRLWGVLK